MAWLLQSPSFDGFMLNAPGHLFAGRSHHFQVRNLKVYKIRDLAFAVLFVDFGTLEIVIVPFRVVLQFALDGHVVAQVLRKPHTGAAKSVSLAVAADDMKSIHNLASLEAPGD
jgi:hypothetical protein